MSGSSACLIDPFGRPVQYLRVSVTDRCNLRCVYCMPEHGVPFEQKANLLTVDEIMRIIDLLAPRGLNKVRLTGGEPLVRKQDVLELVGRISQIPQITDLGLTTNGVLLPDCAEELYRQGLRRINLSLDSLLPERFQSITRCDKFEAATDGIEAAKSAGFKPIKINVVVMRGINDDEILDFAALTLTQPLEVRFLEYMPIGQVSPFEWRTKYLGNHDVLARLTEAFDLEAVETAGASTSRVFRITGALGKIGLISPISHKFCEGCNRLRLTSDGKLAPCLSDNYEYDLRTPLREHCSDLELVRHISTAIANKPVQSDFEGRIQRGGSLRIMAQIGG